MDFSTALTKAVIITAGGRGLRIGAPIPKQFIKLVDQPILALTIQKFYDYDPSMQIIVTLPEDEVERWVQIQREIHFAVEHEIVVGGPNRFQSVKNGLSKVTADLVAVHDGVRPFVSEEVIDGCFYKAETAGSAIPVMSIIESIRQVDEGTSKSVNRSKFRKVQTPQVFRSKELQEAYEQEYNDEFTDDASVFEANGGTIHLVDGNVENLKITTPLDLKIAKLLFTTDN